MKVSKIFEKGHSNKGWEKIEKWIEDEDVCVNDLLALVCAKFGMLPQVVKNEEIIQSTKLMVAGEVYKITIEKERKTWAENQK